MKNLLTVIVALVVTGLTPFPCEARQLLWDEQRPASVAHYNLYYTPTLEAPHWTRIAFPTNTTAEIQTPGFYAITATGQDGREVPDTFTK